ncbi:hypothetical protein B0A55_07485 [Friedmanniomyces simplex]|uniref:Clr5 domain-containing protein n=1 Tax=Friedmanniomyces simplex TaxID=329884 RepID=A0A4U0X3H7_9PEZI|nr:hypothetical protein B0A55_07485 [Friedmanniomyces simplex]
MKTASQHPTPDDWARHRARICNLYEKNTLKQVKRIMKEAHGFHATTRMYKTRIAAWGQDKNRKGNEMHAIAAKAHQRRSEAKETVFYVRGKEVPFDSVVCYFARRGIDIEEIATTRRTAHTPPTIICMTPPAGLRSISPLLTPLSTPSVIAMPEKALHWIGQYIQGSFDSGAWFSTCENEYPVRSRVADIAAQAVHGTHMDLLHNQIRMACFLFSKGRAAEAGSSLQAATAGVKELTQFEYPALLDRLPRTLLTVIVDNHMPDIALAVLRQFAAFAKLFHGEHHPFYQFCRLLASLEWSDLVSAIHVVVRSIWNTFENVLGAFQETTLAARYTYVRTVLASQGLDAEATGFREVVRHCRTEAQKIVDETYSRATGAFMDTRIGKLCARVQKKIVIELYKLLGDEHHAHVVEETFWLNEWLEEVETKRVYEVE